MARVMFWSIGSRRGRARLLRGGNQLRYPREFSAGARNRIEAKRIRAYQEFEKAREAASWDSDVQALLRQCILSVFLVFAREACALANSGSARWSIDKIDRECLEFLRIMTIEAWYDKGFDKNGGSFRSVTSNMNGSIETRTMRAFQATAEWQEYQELLLNVAGEDRNDDRDNAAVPRIQPLSLAFASTAQRIEALSVYCQAQDCSEAAVARTARVAPGDLSKWKKGLLPVGSEKTTRIEGVLQNHEAPTPPPKVYPRY
jgi:hypothetical protein